MKNYEKQIREEVKKREKKMQFVRQLYIAFTINQKIKENEYVCKDN